MVLLSSFPYLSGSLPFLMPIKMQKINKKLQTFCFLWYNQDIFLLREQENIKSELK
jgi:hypothetical protein